MSAAPLLLALFAVANCEFVRKPFYQYRYETEDVMKTSASDVPVHGYHVVEGGYYPSEGVGQEGGFARPGGYGGPGGYGPAGLSYGHGGGSETDDGKEDSFRHYERGDGEKGEVARRGESRNHEDGEAAKEVRTDSGYYKEVDGGKRAYEDGRQYQGGHHFGKEGESGEGQNVRQGHKKGHKIKSFKNSHHKDETGSEEEYYDEAHDEGGNYAFKGQRGGYGESGATSFKGGNKEEKYARAEAEKEGRSVKENVSHKSEEEVGQYGGEKHSDNKVLYGLTAGEDEQSLLGRQESSKYYKVHPFVVPFHY